MPWRSSLTPEELKVIEERAAGDFAQAARKALLFGLFRVARSQMSKEEAVRFDAYRYSQISRRQLNSTEANWFDHIQDKAAGLVDNAIMSLDSRTGGHGRQGTAWVEHQLAIVSKSLTSWWRSS